MGMACGTTSSLPDSEPSVACHRAVVVWIQVLQFVVLRSSQTAAASLPQSLIG